MTAPLCLIINLDRAADRWTHMSDMAQARGLNARRIRAIEGAQIDEATRQAIYHRLPERRELALNELACFQSHKMAWQQLVASGEDYALILEDDVFLSQDVAALVQAAVAALPGFSLIKLNNYMRPVYMFIKPAARIADRKILRLMERTIDGSAYLISREYAKTALVRFARFTEELDFALFDPATDPHIYQLCPAASVQQKFADFAFLPSDHEASALEETRKTSQLQAKPKRQRRTIPQKVVAELRRFYWRRIWPVVIEATNPFRAADHRFRRSGVGFVDSAPSAPGSVKT